MTRVRCLNKQKKDYFKHRYPVVVLQANFLPLEKLPKWAMKTSVNMV